MNKLHLINEVGDTIAIEFKNFENKKKQLNETTNTNYHIDVDWYLTNGYSLVENMFKRIENSISK